MFRLLTASILTLIAALVLSGCGNKVNAGEVVERKFIPAHQETWYQQVQVGQTCAGGNPPICTPIYTQVPHTSWEPDEWRIRIRGCKAEEGDFERRTCKDLDRRWVTVSERTYETTKVGDWFEVR
jgi:hypothetical protein